MAAGVATLIVAAMASSSATSGAGPGAIAPGSTQTSATAGQRVPTVPTKLPNATGRSPTTRVLLFEPVGSRKDRTPAVPLVTRTRPAGSTPTPRGPAATCRRSTTALVTV